MHKHKSICGWPKFLICGFAVQLKSIAHRITDAGWAELVSSGLHFALERLHQGPRLPSGEGLFSIRFLESAERDDCGALGKKGDLLRRRDLTEVL